MLGVCDDAFVTAPGWDSLSLRGLSVANCRDSWNEAVNYHKKDK